MATLPARLSVLLRLAAYGAVFLLSMELFARVDDRIRWQAPILAAYSLDNIVLEGPGAPRNRPHTAYQNFRINNHGFRGPDFPLEKPAGVVRVAVVGASETFGLYESPGREFPAQMQEILDKIEPGRFQVINAAAVGMTPPRIREYFHQWLTRFAIDVLVFYPTPVFYLDRQPPRETNLEPVARPPSPVPQHWSDLRLPQRLWVTLRQRLPDTFQTRLKEYVIALRRREIPHTPWEQAPTDRAALFRRHLVELATDVQDAGVALVLATHANRFGDDWRKNDRDQMIGWVRFFPDAAPEGLLDMDARGNATIRAVADEFGLPVADVAAAVRKSPDRFADFAHFTDLGAREAADAMVKAVLASRAKARTGVTDGRLVASEPRTAPAPLAPTAAPARP